MKRWWWLVRLLALGVAVALTLVWLVTGGPNRVDGLSLVCVLVWSLALWAFYHVPETDDAGGYEPFVTDGGHIHLQTAQGEMHMGIDDDPWAIVPMCPAPWPPAGKRVR